MKGCVPGVEEAVDGGAAVAWLVDGGSGRWRCGCSVCSLSLSSLLLVSVLFFSFSFFVFGFGFSILFSLSPACSISLRSPLSPSVSSKKIRPLFSPSVSPFIAKNGAGMLFLVRLQSRLAGRFFRWWWGRGERERGGTKFSKIFFSSVTGFGGRMKKRNSAVQNGTVRSFLFFFLYETTSFWRKRAVSFKDGARTRQNPM